MYKTILIDLDGVIADFPRAFFSYFGKEYDKDHCMKYKGEWMHKLAESGELKTFWNTCGVSFWSSIPVMPDAKEIIQICLRYSNRVGFLTSGACKPTAYAGKLLWIQGHFPEFQKKLFVGSDKEIFANEHTVLVDDWEKNTELFYQAGGHGVLLPRPWNSEQHLDSVLALRSKLSRIFDRR